MSLNLLLKSQIMTGAPLTHRPTNSTARAVQIVRAQSDDTFRLKPQCPLSKLQASTNRQLSGWIENFLAKPHADLHAPNDPKRPVCPFVPTALKRNTIAMRVVEDAAPQAHQVKNVLDEARRDFLAMEPRTGRGAVFKTVIVTFPALDSAMAAELIDEMQRLHKIDFVRQGLMLGEFHSENKTPGLHNPNFFPLRAPVPALAIRYMVDSDLLFLDDPKYTSAERVEYLSVFLKQEFNRNMKAAVAALERAKQELARES